MIDAGVLCSLPLLVTFRCVVLRWSQRMPCHHFCRMLPTAAAVGRRCHVQRVCLLNVRRAQVCYLCHVVTNGGWIFPYIETPFLLHSLFFRMEFIERILPAVLHICALSSLSKPVQHTPAFLFFPPFFSSQSPSLSLLNSLVYGDSPVQSSSTNLFVLGFPVLINNCFTNATG